MTHDIGVKTAILSEQYFAVVLRQVSQQLPVTDVITPLERTNRPAHTIAVALCGAGYAHVNRRDLEH